MMGTAKLTSCGQRRQQRLVRHRIQPLRIVSTGRISLDLTGGGVRAKKPESNRIGQAQITMPDGRIFARGAGNNNQ